MIRRAIALIIFFYTITLSAQNVEGIVFDKITNSPIIGATVIIKNTKIGTITDFDGNFSLSNVPEGAILVFSYLGFVSQELVVNNNNISVYLEPSISELNEVVLVGYGAQSKKEVTGAVSVIDEVKIEKLNPSRVEQAMQGQIPGVNITSGSGSPGSGLNIRIRGISTNGNNNPLILVDGNVIEDLSVINPNDIKSINVLKDATAGIYGVRAANGVVLIETKTGKKDTPLNFSFDAYFGLQQTSKKLDLLGPTNYAIMVNDAAIAANRDAEFLLYPETGTDWQDEVFSTAPIVDLNLNGNGGTTKSAYSFGIALLDQEGIVAPKKSNFKRITARGNIRYDIIENLELSASTIYTNYNVNRLQENSTGSVLFNATNINPTLSVYDSTQSGGYTIAERLGGEIINPVAQIENSYNNFKADRISTNLGVKYTFFDDFVFNTKIQSNYAVVKSHVFRPEVYYGSSKNATTETNEVVENKDTYMDYTWDAFLTYHKNFNDVHDINFLIGTSVFKTTGEFTGMVGRNLNGNTIADAYVENANQITNRYPQSILDREANTFDVRLLSYFSRVQYMYKGKYLFSGVIRRDGSTRFGPNNRFGYFPSASMGWVISEEEFLKDKSFFNLLKLRASYGIIGSDRIRDYGYLSLLNGEGVYVNNQETTSEDLLVGLAEGGLANPEIKWEEQKTANIGIDAYLLDDKLNLTIDAFSRRTEGLLISAQVAGVLGASAPGSAAPVINAGTVENKGLEFSLGYEDELTEDLSFNASYNVTYVDNEVTFVSSEGGYEQDGVFGVGLGIVPSRMESGFPLGYFYGFKTDGIFQTQDEIDQSPVLTAGDNQPPAVKTRPGDLKFVDIDGDGFVNDEDKTYIGDPIPDYTMGFNLTVNYKKFDFGISAFASIGNEMVRDYERVELLANRGAYLLDRWTGSGTSNYVPRVSGKATVNNQYFSDYFVEDASFLRIQNIQLGYEFVDMLPNFGITSLRTYLSVNNLHTFTKYQGYDPSASTGNPIGAGIDKGFYPIAKSYFLGFNLKF